MQTSQIKIGLTYAFKDGDQIVRFTPKEIRTVTVRTSSKASPADTSNEITGIIAEGDLPDTKAEDRVRTVGPNQLLGSYDNWAALRDKQQREDQLKKEDQERKAEVRTRLQALFYRLSGIERPAEVRYHNEPIYVDYSGVTIRGDETVSALLGALETLERFKGDIAARESRITGLK